MAANNNLHPHPLVRKLDSICILTQNEREALLNLPMQVQDIRARQDVVREGDRPSRSCLLLEGVACSFKITGEGKRQITAFHVSGDMPDLQSLHLRTLDTSVGTITACKVGFIQHESLRELCARFAGITNAFWRQTLIDSATFREWTANLGQREAYSRVAHVLCELVTRMRVVGLVQDHTCHFPITQSELADPPACPPYMSAGRCRTSGPRG